MRQMIDPSTIKVDTSNFWNMGTHFEGTGSNNDRRYFGWNDGYHCFFFEKQSSIGQDALGIHSGGPTYGITSNGFFYIPSGVSLDSNQPIGVENPCQVFEFPTKKDSLTKDEFHNVLTDKTLKTLFGQSIYSRYGTGNIDLYAHDITITKGTGKAFLTVYSSKNTNIDSLDDLKTIAGATFTKSCTGYINSKVIVAITETSFILSDGTTEVLTGATFVDNPTTI